MSDLKFPLTKTWWTIVESLGDGSACTRFFETEELAQLSADLDDEPFTENDPERFTVTVSRDGAISINRRITDFSETLEKVYRFSKEKAELVQRFLSSSSGQAAFSDWVEEDKRSLLEDLDAAIKKG